MRKRLSTVMLLTFMSGLAFAQSEVFVCINDHGAKEYKNTGTTKGCKRVDLQGINMIPSPYKKPIVQTAARSEAAAVFPRVDTETQKTRDNDRMQILLNEMKTEENKLASLKKDFNNGEPDRQGNEKNYAKYQDRVATMKEDLNRTERNIEALKREISNLK